MNKERINNRIGKVFIIFLFFLIVNLLTSCVSSLPAPESNDDTLLIVVTEKRMDPGGKIFNYYEMKTDKSDAAITITPKKEFCFTTEFPPGKYQNLTIQLKVFRELV